MEIYEPISGLKVITPDRFGDHRGFFGEVWNLWRYEKLGIDIEFVQDNISFSAQAGTDARSVLCRERLWKIPQEFNRNGNLKHGQLAPARRTARHGWPKLLKASTDRF